MKSCGVDFGFELKKIRLRCNKVKVIVIFVGVKCLIMGNYKLRYGLVFDSLRTVEQPLIEFADCCSELHAKIKLLQYVRLRFKDYVRVEVYSVELMIIK